MVLGRFDTEIWVVLGRASLMSRRDSLAFRYYGIKEEEGTTGCPHVPAYDYNFVARAAIRIPTVEIVDLAPFCEQALPDGCSVRNPEVLLIHYICLVFRGEVTCARGRHVLGILPRM